MQELSVKDQIKKLVELQEVDSEIYELKNQLKEKPIIIGNLKNEFEQSKSKLNLLEEELKVIQVKKKEDELALKGQEDDIVKHNSQLSQLKTNKEYSAKIREIESIKADRSRVEESILISYDEIDKKNSEIEKEKINVAEREKFYLSKKKEIEDDIRVIEDRIKVLNSQREQITPGINCEYLNRYEKILEHKDGLAITSVAGTTCGGCFMNITAQMINALKMSEQIVECEKCSRILYIEDEL